MRGTLAILEKTNASCLINTLFPVVIYPAVKSLLMFIQILVFVKGVWVHVEGQTSPHFDNNGHVTGTDSSNSLIHELTEYLQYARNHHVFIFLCLWNGAERGSTNWRLEGLIKDTGKLHSYINHALIPMVKALKDQPALAGWDIINEMEGVINPNLHNSEPCFDTTFLAPSGAGWKGHIHSAQDLLRL